MVNHTPKGRRRISTGFRKLVTSRWGVLVLALLTIGTCAWLWRIEALRPWIAGVGTALVVFLGPIPGLLSEKTRGKWLVLIAVSAVAGVATWFASKLEEKEREEARFDIAFSMSLLQQLSPDAKDGLIKGVAPLLRELVHQHEYEKVKRGGAILLALKPANGYALYFAGESFRGLGDSGNMLTEFKAYLANADTGYKEVAFSGTYDDCYLRPNGYCAQRTAWIEQLLANYFFKTAQSVTGSEKVAALQQVVTEIGYMLKSRKIGFDADLTTHDTTDLLRQSAVQLRALQQSPDSAQSLLDTIIEERKKAAGGGVTRPPPKQ